ncbi:MAG: glycosyltransferase family 2 protein [Allosphingosinicella sp.]
MFSVVIPLFNNRTTIARAVRSVLAQRGPEFELIVVDDGSTDGGLEALSGFADSRLRTIRQDNAGAGAARDAGVAAAKHDWAAFLDADDFWLEGHLEELDAVRAACPEAGLIGTAAAAAAPGAAEVFVADGPSDIRLIRYLAAVGRGERTFGASSAAVRKAAWRAVGGFSRSLEGPDREFWARLSLAWPVAVSSRVTAVYVRAAGSDSDRARARKFGRPPQSLADLSYSVAMLTELYGALPPHVQAEVDLFAIRYLDYRLREAIASGDLATLRALRRLYPAPPPLEHRLLLAAARLPDRLALGVYRVGLAAKAAGRRLYGRRGAGRGRWIRIPEPERG